MKMLYLEAIMKMLAVPALVVGLLILCSNFVDINYWISKMLLRPATPPKAKKDSGFLEIVDLWYQLRSKCEAYELPSALAKLDEVFPLLNDKLDTHSTEVKNV
jgi:hypothetical protein